MGGKNEVFLLSFILTSFSPVRIPPNRAFCYFYLKVWHVFLHHVSRVWHKAPVFTPHLSSMDFVLRPALARSARNIICRCIISEVKAI